MASPASTTTTTHPTDGAHGGSAVPHTSSAARAAVDVVVITTRDDFLLELGQALGGQASITPVESAAEALQQLNRSKRMQILAMDSRDMEDLRADVDAVQAAAPSVAVLVFAESDAEQTIAAALKGSKVFAVLPVPVDSRKTAAIFGGAVADSKGKQSATPAAARSSITVSGPAEAPAPEPIRPTPRDDGGSKINLRIVGGIALAVLAAIVVWFLTRDKTPPAHTTANTQAASPGAPLPADSSTVSTPVESAPPAVETSLVKGKVDELLEKARTAMRERRYTEPAGDNALLYYRSAAAADAANAEAVDGLTRVGSVLAGRFEDAMAASRYEEAATTLAQLKNAVPSDARIATFRVQLTSAQVTKALADENPERAAALVRVAQQANDVPAAQLTKWRTEISRVQEDVKQKRLAEQQAARDAAAAEQKKARDARAAAAEIDRKAQLEREKEAQEKLKAQQAPLAAQTATKTTQNPASGRSGASLQAALKRKRYVAPEYPRDALDKGIGGTVTVAFTVDVNGETRDIHVESADPPGVFDRAAIAAVKRWRYEPLLTDGVATEVPARMAIRFAPPPP